MQLDEYAELVAEMLNRLEPNHLLDYHCGADIALAKALATKGVTCAFKYQAYDPQVPKLAAMPFPAHLVVSLGALGKARDEADAVALLDDLRKVNDGVGFFVISRSPMPVEWWVPQIMSRFDLQTFQASGEDEYYVVAYAKPIAIEAPGGSKFHA